MLTNIKIRQRLYLGFGTVLLLMAVITGIAWYGFSLASDSLATVKEMNTKMVLSKDVHVDVQDAALAVGAVAGSEDAKVVQQQLERLKGIRAAYLKNMQELKATARSEESRRMTTDVETAVGQSRDINNRVIELAKAGKRADAVKLYTAETLPSVIKLAEPFDRLNVRRNEQLEAAEASAAAAARMIRVVMVVVLLVAVGTALVIGLVITRGIVDPLAVAMGHMEELAAGDFSRELSGALLQRRDEMGAMARSLQETIQGDLDWTTYALAILRILAVPMVLHGLYDTLLKKEFELWALLVGVATFAWFALQVEMARSSDAETKRVRRTSLA